MNGGRNVQAFELVGKLGKLHLSGKLVFFLSSAVSFCVLFGEIGEVSG